ncbi:ATPase [Ahniella affigens]|uniref:ATPase n=2 Tax=Ahniella affigens TaxID=2021234 RepID=A0A2P1PYS8_9GAMM|nr:ATPase [Ahniella affigens]
MTHSLTIERRLPGPLERVWRYVADSELRSQWLAAGDLVPKPDAALELVWRNDQLSEATDLRPAGFAEVSSAVCTILSIEPPRHLRFDWPGVGEVTIDLSESSAGVLLRLTHRAIPNLAMRHMVGAGWHAHLDILVALIDGTQAPSFWSHWQTLKRQYESAANT